MRFGATRLTLSRHDDAGHGVGDAGACSEEGYPHDAIRDTQREANKRHHPNHDVREQGDPNNGHHKRHHKPLVPTYYTNKNTV